MDRIAHIPNRSRQFDMRIRYRTLLSPRMTCSVGLRSNNAQDRLATLAILFQRFPCRSDYLCKIHEIQNKYPERLYNMKRSDKYIYWTVVTRKTWNILSSFRYFLSCVPCRLKSAIVNERQ